MTKLIVAGYAIAVLSLVLSMNKMILAFASAATAARRMFNVINMFYTFKKRGPSNIKAIAYAITVLVASLAVLSSLPKEDVEAGTKSLIKALMALAAISAALTLFSSIVNWTGASPALRAFSGFIAALSMVIISLAAAIKIMSGIKITEDLIDMLGLALSSVFILVLITRLVGAKSGIGTVKSFLNLISISVLLLAVAKAMEKLASVEWSKITENMDAIVVTMSLLGIVAVLASHIKLTSAPGLLLLVYLLKNMTGPLMDIVNMAPKFKPLLQALTEYQSTLIIMGAMAALMTFVGGLVGKGVKGFGIGMLALAAAFLVLEKAIVALAAIEITQINKAMGVIKSVFNIFAVMVALISLGGGGKYAFRISVAITLMVASLYLISGAVLVLGSMDPSKVNRGKAAVEGIMLCFAAIMGAASFGQKGAGTVLSVLFLMAGLVTIISQLMLLSLVPYDQLIASTGSMVALLISLRLVLSSLNKMSNNYKLGTGITSAISLAILLGGIVLILNAVKGIAKETTDPIGLATIFGGISVLFMAVAKTYNVLTNTIIDPTIGEKILAFGFLSAFTIALLGGLSEASKYAGSIDKMIGLSVGVSIVIAALSLVISAISKSERFNVSKAGSLVLASASIFLIGASLSDLAKQPWNRIALSCGALVIAMTAFALVVKSLSKISSLNLAKAASIAVASLSIVAIGSALTKVAANPWDRIITAMLAVSVVMGVMAIVMKTIDSIIFDLSDLVAIAAAVGSIVIIAGTLSFLCNTTDESLIPKANTLIEVIGMLGLIFAAIGLIKGTVVSGAMAAVVSIGILIGGIIGVFFGIGLVFATLDWIKNTIKNGVQLLADICVILSEGLGKALHGIIAPFVDDLPHFGDMLSGFMTNLQPFIDGINGIGNDMLDKAGQLALTIIKLSGAEFLNALASLFGKDLGDIGHDLNTFGRGFKKFYDNIKNIDFNYFHVFAEAVSLMGKGISGFAYGSVILEDRSHIRRLMNNLEKFGKGLVDFANQTKGISGDEANGAYDVGIKVAELLKQMPNQGGMVGAVVGNNNIEFFTKKTESGEYQLSAFAKAIVSFANSCKNIPDNAADVDNLLDVGYKLFDLAKALPNEGGKLGWLVGENTISLFTKKSSDGGYELSSFAKAIVSFARSCNNVPGDTTNVDKAIDIATKLFNITLPNQGGFIAEWITGDNKMSDIAPQLPIFGEGIADFCDSVEDIGKGGVNGVQNAIDIVNALWEGDFFSTLKLVLEQEEECLRELINFDFMSGGPIGAADIGGLTEVFADWLTIMSEAFGSVHNNNAFAGSSGAVGLLNEILDSDFFELFGYVVEDMKELFESILHAGSSAGMDDVGGMLEEAGDWLDILAETFGSFVANNALAGCTQAVGLLKTIDDEDIMGVLSNIAEEINDISPANPTLFAMSLGMISNGLNSFNDKTSGLDIERIRYMLETISNMAYIMNSMESTDTASIENFKIGMENLASIGLEEFFKAFESSDTASKANSSIGTLISIMSSAIIEKADQLRTAMEIAIISMTGVFSDPTAVAIMKDAGYKAIHSYTGGMQSAYSEVDKASKEAVDHGVRTIQSQTALQKRKTYKAGFDLVDTGGYSDGEKAAISEVEKASKDAVNKAATTIETTSNSKKSVANKAGSSMVDVFFDGAKTAFKSGLSQLQGLFNTLSGIFSGKTNLAENFGINSILKDLGGGEDGGILGSVAKELENVADSAGAAGSGLGGAGGAAEKAADKFTTLGKAIGSVINSRFSGMTFFEKLELKAETSADSILENMKSNLTGVQDWTDKLAQVAERGLDHGLIQVLAEAGIDSYDQISAFLSMSDEQLAEANALYAQQAQVREDVARRIGVAFQDSGANAVQGLLNGIYEASGKVGGAGEETAREFLTRFNDVLEIHSPSGVMRENGMYIDQGLANGVSFYRFMPVAECLSLARTIISTVSAALNSEYFIRIGGNVCDGLSEGIARNSDGPIKRAKQLAESVAEIMRDALEINSPSHVTQRIGAGICEGLVKGMDDNSKSVEKASENLAKSSISPIEEAIKDASTYVSNNMDVNPTITPMLDLSTLMGQVDSINSMFSDREMALSAKGSRARTGSTFTSDEGVVDETGSVNYNFTQNNYSPKALSRLDIYRDSRNLFSSMKGAAQGS